MQDSRHTSQASLEEVHESVDVNKKSTKFRKFFAFLGPAYMVSVGYMDPGNWATDLAGGSKFGYTLIWVLLMSNLMALLLQSLSARLGIVRGRDLAQANREYYPKGVNFILYLLAEIAIAATDLAEILGMAIGLNMLTGIPLIWAVLLTSLDTVLILFLQKLGIRKLEAFIVALIFVIGSAFLIEIFLVKPDFTEIAKGFVPTIPNSEALYIAIGIIGATVMPHNLYLHSSLVQTRKIKKDTAGIKKALKFNFIDSLVALNLAFLVNAGILILSATVFHKRGMTEIASLSDAYLLLSSTVGNNIAPYLFAIALIAAGQSSTITGTLSGQIVMEGYLKLRISAMMRRLITRLLAIIPTVIVILIYGDNEIEYLLIFSQVILSFQLAFAIIPLIYFVSDKKKMGSFAIKTSIKILAWLTTATIVSLNLKMLFDAAYNFIKNNDNLMAEALILIAGIGFCILLFYIIVYRPSAKNEKIYLHNNPKELHTTEITKPRRIAVALEFSANDAKLISYAISQGDKNCVLLLIHISESPSTQYINNEAGDLETTSDIENLKNYQQQLQRKGIASETYIGYKERAKEIIKFTKNTNADILIMGAHKHKGAEDFIYGQTIEKVRHNIEIPLLIVQVNPA